MPPPGPPPQYLNENPLRVQNWTNLWHDGGLSSRVNESFDVVSIDLAIDVQHDDGAEALGVVLHRKLHVMLDVLVLDFLFLREIKKLGNYLENDEIVSNTNLTNWWIHLQNFTINFYKKYN